MRSIPLLLAIGLTTFTTTAAHADDLFESKGWTLLGEQSISGRRDHDTIVVGRDEGVFTSITVVAASGNFELTKVTVTFGNQQTFSPDVRHAFADGSRSRAIDLPGKLRGIAKIDLVYSNVGRGKTAKVAIWGKEAAPATPEPAWTGTGWTLLGSARATGKRGTATIKLTTKIRGYQRLTFAVNDGDLRITDVDAVYLKGPRGKNKLGLELREGARRAELLLPGRPIKQLQIKYVNLTPTRRATIQVWGKDYLEGTIEPIPMVAGFDTRGWTLIGDQVVDGKRDRDTINVDRKGTFTKMAVTVADSDLSLDNLVVTFGNKQTFAPQIKQVFKEGARSRLIDFPANKRHIDHIDVVYSNLPGGGKARLQIWAK